MTEFGGSNKAGLTESIEQALSTGALVKFLAFGNTLLIDNKLKSSKA